MSEFKLNPCPFCGSETALVLEMGEAPPEDWYNVTCDFNRGGCGGSSGYRHGRENAVDQWNVRYNPTIHDLATWIYTGPPRVPEHLSPASNDEPQ